MDIRTRLKPKLNDEAFQNFHHYFIQNCRNLKPLNIMHPTEGPFDDSKNLVQEEKMPNKHFNWLDILRDRHLADRAKNR